jgi:YHS domain-containing protein
MKKIFWVFGLTVVLSAVLIALAVSDEVAKDPVCGMEVNPAEAQWKVEGKGGTVYFCAESCLLKFSEEPTAYLTQEKLDELQICVGGVCTDPECCQKDAKHASAVEVEGHPCGGCVEEAAATEVEGEAKECTGDCEDCEGHSGETPH